MRGSAAASGQAARARAAGVSTRDQRWSVRLQATDTPVPQGDTNSYHILNQW